MRLGVPVVASLIVGVVTGLTPVPGTAQQSSSTCALDRQGALTTEDAGPAEQPAVALPDAEALRQQFVEADQDGDGRISRDEWLRAFGPAHADAATDGQPGGPDQPTALPVSTPPPTGTAPVVVQP